MRAKVAAWAAALAIAVPSAATAAPKKVTPADAAAKRTAAQTTGRDLATADPTAAGMHYDAKAAEWGDPVLFLDAADAYLDAAEKGEDIAMAEAGIERARIALDILYFHLDASADKNFRMIETTDIADLIARSNTAIDRGEALMEAIAKAAEAPAVAAVDEDEGKKKKKRKKRAPGNGRALVIAGAVATAAGSGLAVLGVAGLAIGAVNQTKAERNTVYGEEYDLVAAKGRRGNVIAGVGLGLGGALLVTGIVMLVVGKKRRNNAAPAQESNVAVAPTLNGVAISGRF